MAESVTKKLPDWRELIGFEATGEQIKGLVQAGRMPQVVLFSGREGLGKRGFLAQVCAYYLCDTHSACGACANCVWLLSGEHPEVFWIEPIAGKILLEQAKELQDFLALKPESGSHRIAVIADADGMLVPTANRLLKTLEEPPEFARILLSTSRSKQMLDTVLSRCIKWQLLPPSLVQVKELVQRTYQGIHGRPPTQSEMDVILKRSGLAPGMALDLCRSGEQMSEFLNELEPLLTAKTPAALLVQKAEELGRGRGLSAVELIDYWEIALNKSYQKALSEPVIGQQPKVISHRREVLRSARKLAERQKVTVNMQLLVEALGGAR